MNPLLTIEDLTFAYPRASPVLKNIHLTLHRGELVGLLGPNGAGKSTLLRAIVGPEALGATPSRGTVSLDTSCPDARARARQVAYLPQHLPDTIGLDVEEIVRLGRFPHTGLFGGHSAGEDALVEQAMRDCGLPSMRRRLASNLSGGERQRVFLASALAQRAPALLLDEPTSALDLQYAMHLLHMLEALAAQGDHAVIIATHDINLAARHCTRLVVMNQGAIVADGPPAETLTGDLLRNVFGVEAAIHTSPETGTPIVQPLRPVPQP